MLLGRAFVLGVSRRGLLAVAAMALAVAYALIATGAMAGLETSSRTIEEAQAEPGWVLFDPDGGPLTAALPAEARTVRVGTADGIALATVTPWPFETDRAFVGGHVAPGAAPGPLLEGLNVSMGAADYAPPDAVTVPPEVFASLAGDGDVVAAFVDGEARPAAGAGLASAPWVGVGVFYEQGAEEVVSGLSLVVVATAAIVALLSAGFLHLEVLARRDDLATVEALGGRPLVRRLVALRTLVLVGAAVLVGVAATFVIFRATAAAGVGPLALDAPRALLIVGVGALAGAAAGTVAGRRALQGADASRGGRATGHVRRFPGPVRFLTVTPRISAGILAATLLSGLVLAAVLNTAAVPSALFGSGDEEIVLVTASANPLRGHADRFLGEQARHLEGVEAAWPETYAPTAYAGAPLLVKGVAFDAWLEGHGARLHEGRWPTASGEVTLGVQASRQTGLDVGDRFAVPRSYHRGVEHLVVVGVHATGGLEDDEVLTEPGTAARLAGLPADEVTLVRVVPEEPGTPWSSLAPRQGIEIVEVTIDPARPAPNGPATVMVRAINFADRDAVRPIAVRLDGNLSAHDTLRMAAHAVEERSYRVVTPGSFVFDLSVNPARQVGASTDVLRVTAPDRARPDTPFVVQVRDVRGPAVADAVVYLDGIRVGTTDASGRLDVSVPGPGLVAVSAVHEGRGGGVVVPVAPVAWDGTAHLVAESVFVGEVRTDGAARARIAVETTFVNLGTEPADTEVVWTVDGTHPVEETVMLAPGRRVTHTTMHPVSVGDHTLAVLGSAVAFTVPEPDAAGPAPPRTIEEAIVAYRGQQTGGGDPASDPTAAFLARTFQGLGSATTVVVVATVVHAGSLVWVAVVREARERAAVRETMRAIGGQTVHVEGRLLLDTFLSTLPALTVGTLGAALALWAARGLGWPRAFGHTLPTAGSWDILLRSAVTILAIALLAAFYVAQPHRRPESSAPPAQDIRSRLEGWR